MGQGPGFMVGPGPGFPGPVYYLPGPPPGAIRGYPPRFGPHPGNQGPQALSPEQLDLKDRHVTLSFCAHLPYIFFFSDENLQNDQYLISLMDEQGWVPIKIIADFKRVKMMTMDVEFIVYALRFSTSVEVQGDKIRKRDEWSKWVPASKRSASEQKTGDNDKDSSESVTSKDNFKNSSKPTAFSSEGAQSSRTNVYESDNLKSLSDDFSNTFLLDEEMDLEHKIPRKSGLSMSKRIDDEDDDIAVDDHDIQKLVIVTQQFEEDLYKDFEKLTLDFYHKGNLYGLEKYWAFHHYRGQKEPTIKKHPELEKLLTEEYRSIADFRAKDTITSQKENKSH
ncbi:hypothetical protein F2Q70_00014599 [Brassica cretica]|uniref:HTH La-type RNA-binding domain-containing protein n=1 Tax=Brassica cretica TaxID=69181 RepID=A0A8S9I2H1_BRACR|nr:hypothetical protein F2Q70_00014599 [Brassica cretica]